MNDAASPQPPSIHGDTPVWGRLVKGLAVLVVIVLGATTFVRYLDDGPSEQELGVPAAGAENTDAAEIAEEGAETVTAEPDPPTAAGDRDAAVAPPELDAWVQSYPGADYAGGNVTEVGDGILRGAFVLTTAASAEEVFEHYEQQLRAGGYKVTTQTTDTGAFGGPSGVLMGRLPTPARTFDVIVSARDGLTHINTQFEGRRE